MPTLITDLEVTRVDLVPEGANSEAFIAIFKSKEGGNEGMTFEEILAKMKPEHAAVIKTAMEESVASVKAENESLAERVAKMEQDAEAEAEAKKAAEAKEEEKEPEDSDVLKGLDPAIAAIVEKARLQASAAEQELKKMKDEQTTAEVITKAKELTNLGTEEKQLVEVLKSLKATDATLYDNVFGIMKAANAMIADGATFEEIGKSSSEDSKDAWGKIDQLADQRAVAKSITKEAAISEVLKEQPELYNEYLKSIN